MVGCHCASKAFSRSNLSLLTPPSSTCAALSVGSNHVVSSFSLSTFTRCSVCLQVLQTTKALIRNSFVTQLKHVNYLECNELADIWSSQDVIDNLQNFLKSIQWQVWPPIARPRQTTRVNSRHQRWNASFLLNNATSLHQARRQPWIVCSLPPCMTAARPPCSVIKAIIELAGLLYATCFKAWSLFRSQLRTTPTGRDFQFCPEKRSQDFSTFTVSLTHKRFSHH